MKMEINGIAMALLGGVLFIGGMAFGYSKAREKFIEALLVGVCSNDETEKEDKES